MIDKRLLELLTRNEKVKLELITSKFVDIYEVNSEIIDLISLSKNALTTNNSEVAKNIIRLPVIMEERCGKYYHRATRSGLVKELKLQGIRIMLNDDYINYYRIEVMTPAIAIIGRKHFWIVAGNDGRAKLLDMDGTIVEPPGTEVISRVRGIVKEIAELLGCSDVDRLLEYIMWSNEFEVTTSGVVELKTGHKSAPIFDAEYEVVCGKRYETVEDIFDDWLGYERLVSVWALSRATLIFYHYHEFISGAPNDTAIDIHRLIFMVDSEEIKRKLWRLLNEVEDVLRDALKKLK